MADFSGEFDNFTQRLAAEGGLTALPAVVRNAIGNSVSLQAARGDAGAAATDGSQALRKWASMRMQTLYRTLSGMMRNQQALELLMRTQLPELAEEGLLALLKGKFTCLAALQRYHVMTPTELADVEILFGEFPLLQVPLHAVTCRCIPSSRWPTSSSRRTVTCRYMPLHAVTYPPPGGLHRAADGRHE